MCEGGVGPQSAALGGRAGKGQMRTVYNICAICNFSLLGHIHRTRKMSKEDSRIIFVQLDFIVLGIFFLKKRFSVFFLE